MKYTITDIFGYTREVTKKEFYIHKYLFYFVAVGFGLSLLGVIIDILL